MRKQIPLFLLLYGLVACSQATPTSIPSVSAPTQPATVPGPTQPAPTPPPTVTAQLAPHAAGTATRSIPTARPPSSPLPNGKTFSDPALGVSFIYPPDWENLPRAADALPGVSLHGPPLGNGPEPFIFIISVEVQPATEASVGAVVDEEVAQAPSNLQGGIQRRTLTVGGTPAEEVIGLPSQAGAIETFVLHSGSLYIVYLQPYDETNRSLAPFLSQVRAVYNGILASFKFK